MTLLTRLRRLLANMDDDALAALANRGLVRRAAKDLESCRPRLLEETEDAVRLQVGEFEVRIPATPAEATSTSPAPGIDRYVVAALLFLRQQGPAAGGENDSENDSENGGEVCGGDSQDRGENRGAAPGTLASGDGASSAGGKSETGAGGGAGGGAGAAAGGAQLEQARRELLAVTAERLRKFAGKARWRRATAAAAELSVEVEERDCIVIRSPSDGWVCRWIPGGGLENMLCQGAADEATAKTAAVLAYQRAVDGREIPDVDAVGGAAAEAPRSREQVRQAVRAVLEQFVGGGLSRISLALLQQLRTLAVSAHGVDLPRLERQLQSLCEEVRRMLRRDSQAAAGAVLAQAADAFALCAALERPTPELVGRHRSRYVAVGAVELTGLGARQWRTRSGYVGLTLYFWDHSCGRISTWSDARPEQDEAAGRGPAFDPLRRYGEGGPWPGAGGPRQACRKRLQLRNAFRNHDGRLSARGASTAEVIGESNLAKLPWLDDWGALQERAESLFGGGLGDRGERDALLLLRPAAWRPGRYDPVRQSAVRTIVDRHGAGAELFLAYDELRTQTAIRWLESYRPADNRGVLALLRPNPPGWRLEPISFYDSRSVVNLTLDEPGDLIAGGEIANAPRERGSGAAAGPKGGPKTGPGAGEASLPGTASLPGELSLPGAGEASLDDPLRQALEAWQAELLALAESGIRSGLRLDGLEQALSRLEALELHVCAAPGRRLREAVQAARQTDPTAATRRAAQLLLQCCYTHRLASIAVG